MPSAPSFTRHRGFGPRRLLLAALCAVLVVGLAPALAGAAPAGGTEPPGAAAVDAKLDERVLTALEDTDTTDVYVRLAADADTSKAAKLGDRTVRGQQVVDTLRGTADRAQAPVRTLLDAEGLRYRAFWVSNTILVRGVSLEQARALAGTAGVADLVAPPRYTAPDPVRTQATAAAAAGVEWGVANINADDVWATYGAHGEGIVVASIDTGVQFDHPALVGSYRGNNGDGTFDHNYNWFDAQGTCPAAPCDNNGHGTHTMGTMAGDDGAGNQIGVAPGVRWIAANGCCPSAEALLASAQWMLAPTDLSGQNPDVSKRPHVVNNSWGTDVPSTDPFFEDIEQAWEDSGILGIWANGNEGPGCATSGSPGSRTISYSVGAYDINNTVAGFSSRGPGQDGQVKPNISAPGVNVRSSVPGNGYGIADGTSMATPHVVGAVALLWSARPALSRNLDATRTLLDLSAVDTPDDQCGGTAEDNNVYGEGRLDALALVDLGSGAAGRITGTVTAADTGRPVPGADVTATGPIERTAHTAEDGTYTIALVPGEYQMRVSGVFGYTDATATLTVADGQQVGHDVALLPTSRVAVSGTVTDGSGHGWPLYAKLVADDGAGHELVAFTDPATGRYSLPVVPDLRYTLRTTAAYPGYPPVDLAVPVGDADLTRDVVLGVDPVSCAAPGYRSVLVGATESFDGRRTGWRVTNRDPHLPGYDADPGWRLDNPGRRPNNTGGTGRFAIVDSDHYGQRHVQDTVLTSPTLDLAGARSPVLRFGTDLKPAVNSTASVELSVDGGRHWTTVWQAAGFPGRPGPDEQVVALPQAAGKRAVTVRFRYVGQWSMWWQVDNVFIGNQACEALPGGLVVGQVSDATTGAALTGATVTSAADPDRPARTVATPDDRAVGDGLYWLFTPPGDQQVTAALSGYQSGGGTATVTADQVAELDIGLRPAS